MIKKIFRRKYIPSIVDNLTFCKFCIKLQIYYTKKKIEIQIKKNFTYKLNKIISNIFSGLDPLFSGLNPG